MTRQMTDDETTVLEVIRYIQERGGLAFSDDIKSKCVLTQGEVEIALGSLKMSGDVEISPRGWVTTA